MEESVGSGENTGGYQIVLLFDIRVMMWQEANGHWGLRAWCTYL